MATRTGVTTKPNKGVLKIVWSGLLNGDDGTFLDAPTYPDKTVTVEGTPGVGFSIQIEDGNANILNDPQDAALSGNLVNDTKVILENPEKLRPNVTAGDGTTNVTVTLIATSLQR